MWSAIVVSGGLWRFIRIAKAAKMSSKTKNTRYVICFNFSKMCALMFNLVLIFSEKKKPYLRIFQNVAYFDYCKNKKPPPEVPQIKLRLINVIEVTSKFAGSAFFITNDGDCHVMVIIEPQPHLWYLSWHYIWSSFFQLWLFMSGRKRKRFTMH